MLRLFGCLTSNANSPTVTVQAHLQLLVIVPARYVNIPIRLNPHAPRVGGLAAWIADGEAKRRARHVLSVALGPRYPTQIAISAGTQGRRSASA
jgi:hypothetical protein